MFKLRQSEFDTPGWLVPNEHYYGGSSGCPDYPMRWLIRHHKDEIIERYGQETWDMIDKVCLAKGEVREYCDGGRIKNGVEYASLVLWQDRLEFAYDEPIQGCQMLDIVEVPNTKGISKEFITTTSYVGMNNVTGWVDKEYLKELRSQMEKLNENEKIVLLEWDGGEIVEYELNVGDIQSGHEAIFGVKFGDKYGTLETTENYDEWFFKASDEETAKNFAVVGDAVDNEKKVRKMQ